MPNEKQSLAAIQSVIPLESGIHASFNGRSW
jgi:hypothetical protein